MNSGFDIGLKHSALVIIDDNAKVVKEFQMGSETSTEFKDAVHWHPAKRYTLYCDALDAFLKENVSIIGTMIMEQVISKMGGKFNLLYELKGALLVTFYKYIPWEKIILISPTAIKKGFMKDGGADKQAIMNRCKKLGYSPSNDHKGDAFAMAWCGLNEKFK